MKILIIGGSGFVSGTLARLAAENGHATWTLTRGQRRLPGGATPLVADRHETGAFRQAIHSAATDWDLVVDCIAFSPAEIRQDLAELSGLAGHLVYISTDFVYDPDRRRLPQSEVLADYIMEGYGGQKRQAELLLSQPGNQPLPWTILRPCHIYGPGSLLGCLPTHGRDPGLLERLRQGQPLDLVGGGYFLQQPLLASDLAETILSIASLPGTGGQTFNVAGPEIIESRAYYRIVADILGVPLRVHELPVETYRVEHPESAPFLCHRFYDLSRLSAYGAAVPHTPLHVGLEAQVRSLQGMA